MSLPEVLLVLREDHRRESTRALLALQTEALAAFAVWDKDAGRKLERLRALLLDVLNTSPVQVADSPKFAEVLTQWGAVVENCNNR